MSNSIKKLIFLIFIVFIVPINNSNAYIDPGTGSFIIQAILAVIATIGATISATYINFKNLIRKIFKKKNKKE